MTRQVASAPDVSADAKGSVLVFGSKKNPPPITPMRHCALNPSSVCSSTRRGVRDSWRVAPSRHTSTAKALPADPSTAFFKPSNVKIETPSMCVMTSPNRKSACAAAERGTTADTRAIFTFGPGTASSCSFRRMMNS